VDYVLVFAKTVLDSKTNVSEGVNAFLVQVRNPQTGVTNKGVTIEDLGEQRSSGLPKGAVAFSKVALPRESLLDGLVKVTDEGKAQSQLKPHARVVAYVDRMTYWQVAVSSCALGVIKAGLHVGVRFARHRWTVSETQKVINPLMSHQLHQHALVPLAARALVYNFAHNLTKQRFATAPTDELSVVLSSLCKACMTDFANTSIATISSYAGVLGLSVYNRLQEYQQAARMYCCEAGDNRLLATKASRLLVTLQQNGKYQLPANKPLSKVAETGQLDSLDTLLALLRLRESVLFEKVTEKFARLRSQARTPYDIYTHFLAADQLAHAHAHFDRVALEQTLQAAEGMREGELAELLRLFARIFAAEVVHNDLALFLVKGTIESRAAEGTAEWLDSLLKQGGNKVDFLLAFWNVPTEQMQVPIAAE
jgi:acyl-CoA oxidase